MNTRRLTVKARAKPLNGKRERVGCWRIICGSIGCSGNLGVAHLPLPGVRPRDQIQQHDRRPTHIEAHSVRPGDAFLEHRAAGYYQIADGVYGVRKNPALARDGYEVGRRPLPKRFQFEAAREGINLDAVEAEHGPMDRVIVGHLPILPCVVVCPDCGARNRVEVPGATP